MINLKFTDQLLNYRSTTEQKCIIRLLLSDLVLYCLLRLRVLLIMGPLITWVGRMHGAMMLSTLPVLGRPTNLDYSMARVYCACSRCGWEYLDIFLSSVISLFFLSLSGRRPDID